MGLIYKATNEINGKSYIGQTSRSLEDRKKNHLNANDNLYFHNALKKYNFQWTILENNISEKELHIKEKKYIQKYNTYKNGYNMTPGGEISPMKIPELVAKMAKTKKGQGLGIKRPEQSRRMKRNNPAKRSEVRKKLSECKLGEKNPNFGKKLNFSDERNRKISEANKGKKFSEKHRKRISDAMKDRIRDNRGRFI